LKASPFRAECLIKVFRGGEDMEKVRRAVAVEMAFRGNVWLDKSGREGCCCGDGEPAA
jgi:hypothetical protein